MKPSGVVVGNSCKENDKTKIRKKRAFRVYLYQSILLICRTPIFTKKI